jgi:Tol biopolymer transport system component
MKRFRLLLASLTTLMAASLVLVVPSPAGAVVSGANGRVLFTSDRDGDKEIFQMRPDGTGVIQLTSNTAQDYDPAVSGDGLKIAFISDRDGGPDLYTMAYDGSNVVRMTTNLSTIVESHPTWAPNSTLIAYAGLSSGGDSEIFTIKATGGASTNITNNLTAFDANPAWSPGGIKIAFDSTNRGGDTGTEIYTMNNDGTIVTKLTTSGTDSNPSYAPDNKNLTFESARDNAPQGGASVFANMTKPMGIAVTTTRVLAMQFNSDKIKQIDSNGIVSNFATLPPSGLSVERYLAISPGLGGFPAGYIYATVGQNIYKVSPDGLTVTLFVNIPALATGETGITFDTVGTFGFKMILTDRRGPVWSVDSAGTATQIGDFGVQIEGPLVTASTFGTFGGWVWGGNEFQNGVYAMSNTGTVVQVGAGGELNSPEGLIQIPTTVCTMGTSGGAYFIGMEDQNQLMKFGTFDFQGFGGDLLAPSELDTHISRIHWNGTSYEFLHLSDPIGIPDLEGSAFAPCASGSPQQASQTLVPGPHEIYKMTSAGLNQTRLTTNTTDDINPGFSPDGLTIVFQADRDDPGQPACEGTATCKYELYTMASSNGSAQTNVTNNVTANDSVPEFQAVSRVVTVNDFFFNPATVKPTQGGTVLWDNVSGSSHTITENNGMGLFDSGTKAPDTTFAFRFVAAGSYSYLCTIHPIMVGTVKVPILAAPKTGNTTTLFTITWAAASIPAGYNVDIQISRPGGPGFVDWKTNQTNTQKSGTFTADAGTGTYSFQARLQNTASGNASNYSTPVTITVNP